MNPRRRALNALNAIREEINDTSWDKIKNEVACPCTLLRSRDGKYVIVSYQKGQYVYVRGDDPKKFKEAYRVIKSAKAVSNPRLAECLILSAMDLLGECYTMKINQKGLDLLKEFEGYRGTAYKCSAGVLTIGYGHTSRAGAPRVVSGMTISREEGEEILKNDLVKYENYVLEALGKSVHQLSSNQFSALVSLCYNIGPGGFKRSSVARYIREGKIEAAADRILMWNKAGGKVLRGLVRRRQAERELYLS